MVSDVQGFFMHETQPKSHVLAFCVTACQPMHTALPSHPKIVKSFPAEMLLVRLEEAWGLNELPSSIALFSLNTWCAQSTSGNEVQYPRRT